MEGVAIDSRNLHPGQLFIALKGERADGHDFLLQAEERASAVMVSRGSTSRLPQIIVEDTHRALQDLGRHAYARLRGVVIAVTGSVGKTTTKELLSLALSKPGRTVAVSPGNLNSTIGLPLSLCNVPEDADYVILEMAMSQPGELDRLGSIAPPHILLYTAIRPAHTAFFASMDEVARAKGELLRHLIDSGTLVYNAEDPYLQTIAGEWSGPSVTFGIKRGDLTGTVINSRGFLGAELQVASPGSSTVLTLPEGHVPATNVLAAMAVGHAIGESMTELAERIQGFRPLRHRGNLIRAGNGITLIDDCYNASPSAVEAALDQFKSTPVRGRKIFVFGDMKELGKREEEDHRHVGRLASSTVQILLCVGSLARLAGEQCGPDVQTCNFLSAEDAARWVRNHAQPEDWILVKGSRSMGLERVISSFEVKS